MLLYRARGAGFFARGQATGLRDNAATSREIRGRGLLVRSAQEHTSETKLLCAARRLFCREGIHATGVSRILKEAGVARKTLYERFGSKDNLLRAVFAAEAEMWIDWFDNELPQRSSVAPEQLLSLFELLDRWFSSGEFFGCVFINAVAEHEKGAGWIRDVAVAHRTRINERVRTLVILAGAGDPDLTTEKLSLIIDGAIVTAMVTGDAHVARIGREAANDILRCAVGDTTLK